MPDFRYAPQYFRASSPITFDNPIGDNSHGQQVVTLRYDAVDQFLHQIRTKTFAKGTCGDSGGPLLQMDEDGRHILVGICSSGDSCNQHSKNMLNYFTDVRANLDWICKHSGVCPVEESAYKQPRKL
ncbi:unnamed protein product [Cylicocyclus nassatus]|uniref:Peptidase S1 domain-containing protein n=1 Tax=Cylicocyclus nassatus TaxID=53992 RepID=A0AA36MER9_CYLNA|nr:unnamed protein product [Cylicocyclus nassatus]